ncbi:hypothetical protein MSAN_00130000 [Mycena sanguinolenta]|uniref:GRF-type domain-containing protein n=1 Tax=Mycena sanguinolenta TaxID=230812 RepID=A0A8H7DK31_9AGAR|nr:hypothetical protein MSAN_00130000 [Mycena sanguinolenta]
MSSPLKRLALDDAEPEDRLSPKRQKHASSATIHNIKETRADRSAAQIQGPMKEATDSMKDRTPNPAAAHKVVSPTAPPVPAAIVPPAVECFCDKPAQHLTVHADTKNKGRPFEKCHYYEPRCKYWEWSDKKGPVVAL